jgi:S1-C subfamily serine protease
MNRILWLLLLVPSFAMAQDFDTPQTRMTAIEQPSKVLWVELNAVTQSVEESAKNAVRLVFPGNGFSHGGSGVYLGDRYVATAHHVPEGTSGRGVVHFRDGTQIGCTVNGRDTKWDQCILTLDREHPTLPGVDIATENPRVGDELYSAGFGAGFRIFGGQVTGFSGNGSGAFDWVNHRQQSVQGDSGGPIFNQTGQLVGCLWGAGTGETVGTTTSRFRIFIKPLFPRLAQWRANRIGRQIAGVGFECPDGSCQQQPSQQGGRPVQQEPGAQPTPVEPDLDSGTSLRPPLNCPPGPQGPKGEPGKDGKDGRDGQVTEEHLASIVAAVVSNLKNDPSTRGPKGDTGQVGPTGPTGPPGKDGQGVTPEQLAALKAELLAEIQHPNIRVVIGNGGKIVDDETYRPGEPIVLDIEALVRAANAN